MPADETRLADMSQKWLGKVSESDGGVSRKYTDNMVKVESYTSAK